LKTKMQPQFWKHPSFETSSCSIRNTLDCKEKDPFFLLTVNWIITMSSFSDRYRKRLKSDKTDKVQDRSKAIIKVRYLIFDLFDGYIDGQVSRLTRLT
jgi:hypothetical protein